MSILLFVLNNLIKFAFPLVMFLWSLFHTTVASYAFVVLAGLFVAYLFFMDKGTRPEPDPELWTPDEIKVIREYHLALRFPFGARDFSCHLNGIRWSSLIWIPWMLWHRLWVPAGFLAVNFLATASLSVRLDPFFFLSHAVNSGHSHVAHELATLQGVNDKLNELGAAQQPPERDK